MDNDRCIFTAVDYGQVVFDIKPIMKNKKLDVRKIVKKTGLHHDVVTRYCKGEATRFDGDVLSRLCYILDCELNDIMRYEKPKE